MFSFPDASRHLGASLEFSNPSCYATGASIDTRTIEPGDLFIAIRGMRTDGHEYLEEAFRKGASGALVDQAVVHSQSDRFLNDAAKLFQNLLLVPDTQKSLADLALWYRLRLGPVCIGITGSVGKTSTKEFLRYLLSQKYPVLANRGNFNNHLGLPLTLLRLQSADRFCVAELGANHRGEIRDLACLLKPSAGMITQISPAHLEGFGSLEAVYEAKLELLESLKPGSVAVLPASDRVLTEKARQMDLKVVRVGDSDEAEFCVSDIRVKKSFVHFKLNRQRKYAFPGIGGFLAYNAAMAIAMAESLGMPPEDIPKVWRALELPEGRFQEHRLKNGVCLINDAYNASPVSFERALNAFHALEVSGKKIVVFADMLELGAEERQYHEALGRSLARYGFDYVAAYGGRACLSIDALHSENPALGADHFQSPEEVVHALRERIGAGDAVLFKASRGMKMEKVLDLLQMHWEADSLRS